MPGRAYLTRVQLASIPGLPPSVAARLADPAVLRGPARADPPVLRVGGVLTALSVPPPVYVDGLLAIRRGDSAAVRRAEAQLVGSDTLRAFGRELRIHQTLLAAWPVGAGAARAAPPSAAQLLDSLDATAKMSRLAVLGEGYRAFAHAEFAAERGHPADAAAALAVLPQDLDYAVAYFAPAALRQGAWLEAAGQPAAAAEAYARVLRLWRACEPEICPLRDAAAARLARLGRAR